MPALFSTYLVAFSAMAFSAASALTLFYAVRHLALPEEKQTKKLGHATAA